MLAEQRYKILFIQYVKEHLILTFYTTSGKEGWLKAGVVGGYTMLIITDLRIHLPPPPTGTPPSRRRRMENTIDYQIIISLIKFTTKFEEEPVFIDLTLMPSLIVYIPLFIRVAAMRVAARNSLRVKSYPHKSLYIQLIRQHNTAGKH